MLMIVSASVISVALKKKNRISNVRTKSAEANLQEQADTLSTAVRNGPQNVEVQKSLSWEDPYACVGGLFGALLYYDCPFCLKATEHKPSAQNGAYNIMPESLHTLKH